MPIERSYLGSDDPFKKGRFHAGILETTVKIIGSRQRKKQVWLNKERGESQNVVQPRLAGLIRCEETQTANKVGRVTDGK